MASMIQDIRSIRSGLDTLESKTVVDEIANILVQSGVTHAFGLVGGSCAPLVHALHKAGLVVVQSRHEAGAVFQAIEGNLATGAPVACFATTGPGLLNCLAGIGAARWDQAKVVLLSGITSASLRGRGAVQETSAYTLPQDALFGAGSLFHFGAILNHPIELDEVRLRLRSGLARPGGFIAHLGLPLSLQTMPSLPSPPPMRVSSMFTASCPPNAAAEVAELLSDDSWVIWVGAGALGASHEVRSLAERCGARVMSSPRAKGIFPEDHPLYLGVTGAGGHASVAAYLREHRPKHVLVLGTRMSEVTSLFDEDLIPSDSFIQVDLDPSAIGIAYPRVHTLGVQADCQAFLKLLIPRLARGRVTELATEPALPAPVSYRDEGPVRPQALMRAIQTVIIDASAAPVMTEAGNSFAWGNHHLCFREPGRYRTSSGWGSMGHMVSGVVGAATMLGRKAVAIVGDGAMMMNNEINTAVRLAAPAVWIVLNDAKFGIVQQGMRAMKLNPVETDLPRGDFVLFARAMGADGVAVHHEVDLESALALAMRAEGPFVVDVQIDASELSPVIRQRVQSLMRQANLPHAH